MEHLIDKDALVAEIKERIKTYNKGYANGDDSRADALEVLLHDIDTLEVKEVDMEKELSTYLEVVKATDEDINFVDFAKHFFELGLKAQHDNWKVVDNINPPQADRNKIYCVFTKDRHILATVINHPKDEELLQWKCTEFPYHRYDMCEGDEYMQIV